MKDLKETEGDWKVIKGRPVEIVDDQIIDQRIKRLMSTAKAGLFYSKDFGCRIYNHINSSLNGNKIDQVINELKEDIQTDPFVKDCEITAISINPLNLSVEVQLYSGRIFNYEA